MRAIVSAGYSAARLSELTEAGDANLAIREGRDNIEPSAHCPSGGESYFPFTILAAWVLDLNKGSRSNRMSSGERS